MWKVWFKETGADNEMHAACLEKGYKTKGNAAKYGKKVFGDSREYVVAQENPFK